MKKQNEITLRFVAEPTDLNVYGKVHGGAVMKWIDQAGYACAVGWSGCPCVTIFVGGIRFYKPILVGNVVEVHARLIYTGTTSLHIAVDVKSGDLKKQELVPTTHCVIVFVAVDSNNTPIKVPSWEPQTDEEKALKNYAFRLMELGKHVEEETRPHLSVSD